MDMLEGLRTDGGRRTLGELLQERQWALGEIERLRERIARLQTSRPTIAAPASSSPTARNRLIRLSEVCDMVGLSRSTIYQRIAAGTFPPNCRVGARATRWRMADVEDWMAGIGDRD